MLVCTLGDLLVDVIVRLDAPLASGDDTTARTVLAPGGQAANVAAWARALGADARLVAKRARDEAGELAAGRLRARGVDLRGPEGERTGIVVSVVEPGGDRTMASDRGSAPELRPDELEDDWFACDALHLSGYSLLREPIARAALAATRAGRKRGARVSVDLSSWTLLRDFGPERFRTRLAEIEPDLVFANEREWETLGGLDTPVVIKRGARGIVADGRPYDARPASVVDTTGAGDALAAGYLVGGADLALEAAARCVAQVGAMP